MALSKGTTILDIAGRRFGRLLVVSRNMKSRCAHAGNAAYHLYGGRGIKVCQRWVESFEAFLSDMGPKPSPSHSIDRKDVNGNYEPSNCRWATPREQQANRRDTIRLTMNGETHAIQEWARLRGLPSGVVARRIRSGWTAEKAVNEPISQMHRANGIAAAIASGRSLVAAV